MRKARGSELRAVAGLTVLFVGLVQAAPVIDDVALEAKFTEGLQLAGVEGISGTEAIEALAAARGKIAEIDETSGKAVSDYEQACRAVVIVGSAEYCADCKTTHMGAVSTGWVIDPRGRIVTNHHVLQDKKAEELGVMTFDGRVFGVRRVLAADRDGDAAVLEIDPGDVELSALALADEARTGEAVRVIGHPDGRFYTLSEGIVSRVFSETAGEDKVRRTWLTVTADYGAGSSGAPVLSAAGKVVGMVSTTAALLADTEEGEEPAAEDVQMVFRDCVSIETIRRLLPPTGDR
jgi:S1-C subfamily serine protease